MSEPTLYAVSIDFDRAGITAWCWGNCGGGLAASIDLDGHLFVPCTRAECPHLERQASTHVAVIDGSPVVLRKLATPPPKGSST